MSPTLLSLRVGRPRVLDGAGDPWTTAFFKDPVAGPVSLGVTGLDGDEQADPMVHGGPDKAVCVYSADRFPAWRRELGLPIEPGAFGENFTVSGQTENDVAIGDVFEVGEALVQVSQPRGPCWKLARRWDRTDLLRRVILKGWSGWYLRVLRPGRVRGGDALVTVERPAPEWTITRVNRLTYTSEDDSRAPQTAALAALPLLARAWRLSLARRVVGSAPGGSAVVARPRER